MWKQNESAKGNGGNVIKKIGTVLKLIIKAKVIKIIKEKG